MTNKVDLDQVLSFPMEDNDADAETVGHYLYSLLWMVWQHGEGFSGKRPFGNSSWEYDLYKPLVAGGFVRGELDEDGYIDDVDEMAANKLIFECIDHVFRDYKN